MEDVNSAIFAQAKIEYTKQLIDVLKIPIYEGIQKIYNEIVIKSDVTGAITDLSLMFPDRKSSVTVGPRGQQGESWAKSLTPEIRNQHNSINYAGKSFAQSANIYFKGALGEITYGEDGMPIYEKGTLLAGSGAVLQTMTENWLDPQYGFIESILLLIISYFLMNDLLTN